MRNFKEFQKNVVGFTSCRIDHGDRLEPYFYYETRHGDLNWAAPLSIEPRVAVNFCGTLVTTTPLDIPTDYLALTAEQGYILREMTLPQELQTQLHLTGEPL